MGAAAARAPAGLTDGPGCRERALRRAAEIGLDYLAGLADRHVGARADAATIRERLPAGCRRSDGSGAVIEELAAAADPGIVASVGPRYFGFVVGGQLPARRQRTG